MTGEEVDELPTSGGIPLPPPRSGTGLHQGVQGFDKAICRGGGWSLTNPSGIHLCRAQAATPDRPHTHAVATPARPRRHRPVNPHAAANALALQHQDIAERVVANIARPTEHPMEDLHQIAMLGILQAARRYIPERGSFRPYARTYANGEVYHYLRDKGFLIKVPASYRELHARGLKLMRLGVEAAEVPGRLGSVRNGGGRLCRLASRGWWRLRCGRINAQDQKRALFVCIGGFIALLRRFGNPAG